MVTRFTVTVDSVDEDYVTAKKTVRLGSSGDKKFETPLKAGSHGCTTGCVIYQPYRLFKSDTATKCLSNDDYSRNFINRTRSLLKPGIINITSMAYGDKFVVPSDEVICYMADVQFSCSDVIVTPSWFDLIKNNNHDNSTLYLNLTHKYLEYASYRNNKPIMATIPSCIPRADLTKVIHDLINQDVTSFIIDFNTRLYDVSWMRQFLRLLDQYNIEKESVLSSINCFSGTLKKVEKRTEARDFFGFAVGFDILGDKHVAKGSSSQYQDQQTTRMFDPDTYTYSKKTYSSESDRQKLVSENIRRQVAELANVRNVVEDSIDNLNELFSEKKIDNKFIEPFKKLKSDEKISSLDSFF